MFRIGKQFLCIGHLDEFAHIHDRHPVTEIGDHAQIMGDKEIGQPEIFLQVLQQVEDLIRTDTSNADTASSATIRWGSSARAWAMPRRWRSPPLKAWGNGAYIPAAVRPGSAAPPPDPPALHPSHLLTISGSPTISSTGMRGLSDEKDPGR